MKNISKSERISLRVTKQVKEVIQKGADLADVSLQDFIINVAYVDAMKFLEENKILMSVLGDSEKFNSSIK